MSLESRLEALGPRRLSEEQQDRITKVVSANPGSIQIMQEANAAEGARLVNDLTAALSAGGWTVSYAITVNSASGLYPKGCCIFVNDIHNLNARENLVRSALDIAEFPYTLELNTFARKNFDVTVMVTVKLL